jgi:hypothetical protein
MDASQRTDAPVHVQHAVALARLFAPHTTARTKEPPWAEKARSHGYVYTVMGNAFYGLKLATQRSHGVTP